MMIIHSRFNPPPKPATIVDGLSMTQQCFRDECDINNIIARYKTDGYIGEPTRPPTTQPMFDDFSNATDFQDAQILIAHAQQSFELLPAALRKRFDNDPAELLHFLEKEENRDEAIRLGIISRPSPSAEPAQVCPSSPDSDNREKCLST